MYHGQRRPEPVTVRGSVNGQRILPVGGHQFWFWRTFRDADVARVAAEACHLGLIMLHT